MRSEMIHFLSQALERRKPVFDEARKQGTNCFRLFSGESEGLSGLVVEELGEVLILQVHEGKCRLSTQQIQEAANWYLDEREVKSVYSKVFVADRTKQTASSEYYSELPLAGEAAAEVVQVKENGWKYWIRPHDGFSTGLFLDQRANRKFLSEHASGKTVLNLFAYTCGFSVACAAGGARVTSVDLSSKYLEWGKRNFLLNDLPCETHEFIGTDAISYLKRCQKQGRVFDLVIIDPPSFSRSKSHGVFSLKKDIQRLISLALSVTETGSEIFLSCNYSLWTSASLRQMVEDQAADELKFLKLPRTPLDFKLETSPLSQILFKRL